MSPEDDKESPEKAFAGNTSLHGFNRIASSPGGSPRVLWVIAILGSYTGFGYMFGSMMASYFKYDTITDTTLEFADELLFPAVTICNMNKFDSDKLQVADWSYLSLFLYGIQADIPTILALGVPLDETVNSTMTGVKVEDLVLAKGFNVSPNRMSLCWWRGTNCSERNFTHSFGHYGNCYTFNADADNPLKQTMPGAVNGFMAFVDIKEDKYTESFLVSGNAEVGLKLLVHDPREPPMMDTQGIALAPGNHAFIAIKQILTVSRTPVITTRNFRPNLNRDGGRYRLRTNFDPVLTPHVRKKTCLQRLDQIVDEDREIWSKIRYENHVPPWGVCKDLQLEYYDTYTLNGCYLECRSKHVVRNCSCRPYDLPGTAPSCDPSTMFTCVRAVLAQVITGDLKCDCPVPCRMTSYSTSLSFAGFPNKHTREYLAPLLGMEPSYMGIRFRDNGVVFSVFYEKLNHQKIRQLKAMEEGQLASNIGGMMGLFLGASVLSLLEVCEYLLKRPLGFLGRTRHAKVVHVQPQEPKSATALHKNILKANSRFESFSEFVAMKDNTSSLFANGLKSLIYIEPTFPVGRVPAPCMLSVTTGESTHKSCGTPVVFPTIYPPKLPACLSWLPGSGQ
ncbi:hypothetical protein Bbelb_408380 [Branchiostoma belcheri]|nr:hypothetical protein Bbelb_408380 [Branchiostoma belcheri]